MGKYSLGLDLGNGTYKSAILDENNNLIHSLYIENQGVIPTIIKMFNQLKPLDYNINSCAVIGAGRKLASIIIGSDIIKTEIIAHTFGVTNIIPDVKTIIDLGKEDSKIIFVNQKVIEESEMNVNCSAGCGAYLDNVAYRLNIKIEDFGILALKSKNKINIDSMCSVFGTSSAQNLLNMGVAKKDILMGVANSLVRNYINMFLSGGGEKGSGQIKEPVVFTGGVSRNEAVVKEFESQLKCKIIVPKYAHIMGAIGGAILSSKEKVEKTNFKGFDLNKNDYTIKPFICNDCEENCNIPIVYHNKNKIGVSYAGKCGKY